MEPVDGMAFIGPDAQGGDNVYLVTGDSGQGLTHGTLAGILLADLVAGRDNPWAALYDPGRRTLRATGEQLRAAARAGALLAERVTGPEGEVGSLDEVPRGGGGLLRRGLGWLAVHRDEDGTLHELSAKCTHLGCLVHWNDAERTWDCPCHGSRFAATGEVLHGPATAPLRRH
jgi:nitrite reductase/ring-hydroxylating ferredoxin subunit